MNEVLIVVLAVVGTLGVMALWVWALGWIESRAVRREAEQTREGSSESNGSPRHMRRRDRSDGHMG